MPTNHIHAPHMMHDVVIAMMVVFIYLPIAWMHIDAAKTGTNLHDSDGKSWVFLLHSSGDIARFRAVRDTWFNSGQRVIFGQHAAVADASFSDTFIHDDTSPSSASAFEITRSAFAHAAKAFPKAKYFAKFDDDAYVFKSNLIRAVQQCHDHSRCYYWGYPLRPPARSSLTYASGGAGYILERNALAFLFKCIPVSGQFEDLAVGDCMQQHGIKLNNLVGLHPAHPYQMLRWDTTNSHPPDHICREESLDGYLMPLSYHYVGVDNMKRLHQTSQGGSSSILYKSHHIHDHNDDDDDDDDDHYYAVSKNTTYNSSLVFDEPYHFYHFHATDACYQNISLDKHNTHIIVRVWDDTLIRKHFPSFDSAHSMVSADGLHGTLLFSDLYALASFDMKRVILRTEVLLLFGGTFVEGCSDSGDADLASIITKELDNKHFMSVEQDEVHQYRLASLGIFRADEYPAAAVAHQIYHGKNDWLLKEAGAFVDPYLYVMHFYRRYGTPRSFQDVLHNYASNVHPTALRSKLWVVARLPAPAGMCNRIMHILSCTAFAIASNRAILFDWTQTATERHVNGIETITQSNYWDLFSPLPMVNLSYSMAVKQYGSVNHGPIITEIPSIDAFVTDPVIEIERLDWWAHTLINTERPTVFANAGSSGVFSRLFKFLFNPKILPENVTACDWLIQHRSHWERPTASIEAFIHCAQVLIVYPLLKCAYFFL